MAAGHGDTVATPKGVFADGTRVPPFAADLLDRAPGPTDDVLGTGAGSLLERLRAPVDDAAPSVSGLWHGLHGLRPELRESFPDPLGADRTAYLKWCAGHGMTDYDLDPAFAPPSTS